MNTYYKNGRIMVKHHYVNGDINGKSTLWFENGKVRQTTVFQAGRPNGLSEQYYKNGQKKDSGYYQNGNWVGKWTFWDENGNIIGTEDYE